MVGDDFSLLRKDFAPADPPILIPGGGGGGVVWCFNPKSD